MTTRLFTRFDAWTGGSYELAIELDPVDASSTRIDALWSCPDLDGCYEVADREPHDQVRVDVGALPLETPLHGIARAVIAITTIVCATCVVHAQAKDSSSELAKELSNPVAPLLGVQLQSDLEWGGGPAGDGFRLALTVQPVIPFAITDDWNVISRSNLAFVHQSNLAARDVHASGLANTTESVFLSPKRTRVPGLTWGLGPIVTLPSTDEQLGTRTIGLGPTAALIHTVGPVVYGILVEQVWSVGGGSQVLLQPQVAWTLGSAGTTLRARSETTHEWNTRPWTVPVIIDIAQVVELAERSFEVSLGPIVYVDQPEDAPRWGVRAAITLVPR